MQTAGTSFEPTYSAFFEALETLEKAGVRIPESEFENLDYQLSAFFGIALELKWRGYASRFKEITDLSTKDKKEETDPIADQKRVLETFQRPFRTDPLGSMADLAYFYTQIPMSDVIPRHIFKFLSYAPHLHQDLSENGLAARIVHSLKILLKAEPCPGTSVDALTNIQRADPHYASVVLRCIRHFTPALFKTMGEMLAEEFFKLQAPASSDSPQPCHLPQFFRNLEEACEKWDEKAPSKRLRHYEELKVPSPATELLQMSYDILPGIVFSLPPGPKSDRTLEALKQVSPAWADLVTWSKKKKQKIPFRLEGASP